jgi:hypothetical protein
MANLCGMGHGWGIRTLVQHSSPYGELLFAWIR